MMGEPLFFEIRINIYNLQLMQTKFPNDYLKVCFYQRNETFTLALVEVEMKKKLTQQAVMYENVKTNKRNTGKELI